MFKVIIAGGRTFDDYDLLKKSCDKYLKRKLKTDEVIIISGTARGADRLGERYATERGLQIERHPANWTRNGKRAGYLRNQEMADVADALIAFWDGTSRGTKHMIDIMNKKAEDMVRVVMF